MVSPIVAVPYWEERWLAPYAAGVRGAGATVRPVAMQSPVTPAAALDGAAGLLLIGGGDVAPARFAAADPQGRCRHVEPARDAFELALLDRALARDLPVLAICRGHQVLAVARGGALHLDIPTELPGAAPHSCPQEQLDAHALRVAPGSRLRAILGADAVAVNSRHHQAVRADRPGAGLRVTAVAPDGVVEALESPAHDFVVGVQWHPEDYGSGGRFAALFAAFVARAAARAAASGSTA